MNEQSVLYADEYGNKFWMGGKGFHREDGPAAEHSDGYKAWWVSGKCHRTDGPAIIYPSGLKRWFLNNKEYFSQEEWFQVLTPKQQYNYLWNIDNE